MNDSKSMARILGWSGILPLVLANFAFFKGYGIVAATLGNLYAAIILSFLGAIHWGLALDREQEREAPMLLLWSVIPALWAFMALWWAPPTAILVLILGFIAQWLADWRLRSRVQLPAWFMPLRTGLTTAVIVLLALMLAQILTGT
ncbi:MAG: DUF3429 domain-containing protein [Acidithiobacillus sp.]